MLTFSSDSFPSNGEHKEASALPWGCVVEPLATIPESSKTTVHASRIPRCSNCYAYINPYVRFGRKKWSCPMCRHSNPSTRRYANANDRLDLPELNKAVIEYDLQYGHDVPLSDEELARMQAGGDNRHGGVNGQQTSAPGRGGFGGSRGSSDGSGTGGGGGASDSVKVEYPAYVFFVDVSGDGEYIELVKSAMMASLEAIHPKVWYCVMFCFVMCYVCMYLYLFVPLFGRMYINIRPNVYSYVLI